MTSHKRGSLAGDDGGGDPALTALVVILTGIIGAIVVTPLMNRIRLRDFRARGFAVGMSTAKAASRQGPFR